MTPPATDTDIVNGVGERARAMKASMMNVQKKAGMSFRSVMNTAFRGDNNNGTASTSTSATAAITPESRVKVMNTAAEVFPGLMTDNVLLQKLEIVLEEKANYTPEKTLLATSLCCDEVNRELEDTLKSVYGNNFSMGGLAGFAFGGITSFGGT